MMGWVHLSHKREFNEEMRVLREGKECLKAASHSLNSTGKSFEHVYRPENHTNVNPEYKEINHA